MTTATATPAKLLTADEFAALPDDGRHTELVRGVIIEMPPPKPAHGYICTNFSREISNYVRARDLGRVVSNDSGVVTERGPDTVRGADVAFYSYARVPRGPLPDGYWPTPELVIEVRSPSDRLPALAAKALEYIAAGAVLACVVDPETESVAVFPDNDLPRRLSNGDELTLPEVFPDFSVPVRQFFT
jgi:Uma2 family endonuclease